MHIIILTDQYNQFLIRRFELCFKTGLISGGQNRSNIWQEYKNKSSLLDSDTLAYQFDYTFFWEEVFASTCT